MMYGVVLWSDRQDRKAVIWCEDHGELAYYREPEDCASVSLDAGDWVQFDVASDRKQRKAYNPRLIAEGAFSGLADQLGQAAPAPKPAPAPARRRSAEVISFKPASAQVEGREDRTSRAV